MTTTSQDILLPNLTLFTTGGDFLPQAPRQGLLLLYFYPRDNTSGCTTEATQFAELYPQFQALGVTIYGVSRDSLASHLRFQEKYALPFELISDKEALLCAHFDVIQEKIMYGKKVHGIERSTFLINAANHVVQAWRRVKANGHPLEVLNWLTQHAATLKL